jgi:hypothetical protein
MLCHYAECQILFIIMLNVIVRNIIILNAVILNVIMLNVIMLIVVAPIFQPQLKVSNSKSSHFGGYTSLGQKPLGRQAFGQHM